MSECPHCRALDGAPHRHDCSVARKRGLPRAAAPVKALYLGAVVRFLDGKIHRAAIVVAVSPTILRVLDPQEPSEDFTVTDPQHGSGEEQWSWPCT